MVGLYSATAGKKRRSTARPTRNTSVAETTEPAAAAMIAPRNGTPTCAANAVPRPIATTQAMALASERVATRDRSARLPHTLCRTKITPVAIGASARVGMAR